MQFKKLRNCTYKKQLFLLKTPKNCKSKYQRKFTSAAYQETTRASNQILKKTKELHVEKMYKNPLNNIKNQKNVRAKKNQKKCVSKT